MSALAASVGFQLPLFICTCVLGGIAVFEMATGLVTNLLFIVGLAPILRRLPARAR